MANAFVYASPSQAKDDGRKKQQMWKKFMDTLSWDKLEAKAKGNTITGFVKVFQNAGIPIKESGK